MEVLTSQRREGVPYIRRRRLRPLARDWHVPGHDVPGRAAARTSGAAAGRGSHGRPGGGHRGGSSLVVDRDSHSVAWSQSTPDVVVVPPVVRATPVTGLLTVN